MPKLIALQPRDEYRLWLKFSDGVEGVVDLSYLVGHGVFALWNDYAEFQKAAIGSSGEIVWNDQVDLDSIALYLKITGKQPSDIFPKLRALMEHA
ncbi:MAG: DUF2442 domain-containing protein [Chloroflexi bacterium]|nr:DUF2442 domain-containing protein [Chloroflexota bacterium]